jgi:hypothetical protein
VLLPLPPPLDCEWQHEREETAAVTVAVRARETAGERAGAKGQLPHHSAAAMETSRLAVHPSSHRHRARGATAVQTQQLMLPLPLMLPLRAVRWTEAAARARRFVTALASLPTVPALLPDRMPPADLAV